MEIAVRLARRGWGQVWPHAAEGCVIVARATDGKAGRVVGRGWTDHEGRAVMRAVDALEGAPGGPGGPLEVYLACEPSEDDAARLAALKPEAVFIADRTGEGVSDERPASLVKAGCRVEVGLCRAQARRLNEGFLLRARAGRPHFTLKMATTLDGSIATRAGESRWITNARSRALVQRLRYDADAVMVGSATAVSDDPRLDCRFPGFSGKPAVRIVADARLRLPLTSRLVRTSRDVKTVLLTKADNDRTRVRAYGDCGVDVVTVALDDDKRLDMTDAAAKLAGIGLTRVLVEGGARLAASLLSAGLIDELVWFHAPKIIGGDGRDAVAALGLSGLSELETFEPCDDYKMGGDFVRFYRRQNGVRGGRQA